MTRLPRVSGKVVHVRGSHHYLRKEGASKLVVVPVHRGSVIPPGTLKSILRQAGLTVEEFTDFLG